MRIGRVTGLALMAPVALTLVALVVVPAVILMWYSLFQWVFSSSVGTPSLDNYARVLADPITWKVVVTTLVIGLPTMALCVIGGYAVAYHIVFGSGRGRQTLFILVVTALMASYLVRVYAWRTLLGTSGVVNSALVGAGLIEQPLEFILFSRAAVVIAEVSLLLPLAALTFIAALSGISPELREAARDLGASRLRTLVRVTLPLSGSAILAATALIFFVAASDYLTPVFVGGPDSVTIGRLIADAFGTSADYGRGAALSVLVLISFASIYLLLRLGMRAAGLLPRRI